MENAFSPNPQIIFLEFLRFPKERAMIQYLVQDTYPDYEITFFKEARPLVTVHHVPESNIDNVVFDFGDDDKEQIFEWPLS